jgi:hypothetical protein
MRVEPGKYMFDPDGIAFYLQEVSSAGNFGDICTMQRNQQTGPWGPESPRT